VRIRIPLSAAILAAITLAACSPLRLINAVVASDGYALTADIPYGELPRQKLDVYVPAVPATAVLKPVVVFFFGGGWESGDRDDYRFVGEALTARGNIVVVPDYRLYPDVRFAGFMADAAQAVRWAKRNIDRFGGDPERVYLMGHSSGAHIAAMLTLNREYLETVGMKPAELRGMIGLAGPYDFLPFTRESSKTIFGPETEYWRSQPINYVDGGNPPILLMTGNDDDVVHPRNTRHLAARIAASGGAVQTVEYAGVGHVGILVQLAAPFRGDGSVLKAVSGFVKGAMQR
jgi:acetyl esterase/lipase